MACCHVQKVCALKVFIIGGAYRMALATIDMGSNSYHLLVSEWSQGRLLTRCSAVERVQTALLMEGDQLTPLAIKRALSCLRRFATIAQEQGCTEIVAVGTAALRRASNARLLLGPAQELLGQPVRILSGSEEAALIHRVVASEVSLGAQVGLVIDIGGGSTELIFGSEQQVVALDSLRLGCVSSLQTHFMAAGIGPDSFASCVREARSVIAPVRERYLVGNGPVLACSGTAQVIAQAVGVGCLSRGHLTRLYQRLMQLGEAGQPICLPGIDSNRRLLLPPGLAIMMALFDELKLSRVRTVDVALREGVAIACYQGDFEIATKRCKGGVLS